MNLAHQTSTSNLQQRHFEKREKWGDEEGKEPPTIVSPIISDALYIALL